MKLNLYSNSHAYRSYLKTLNKVQDIRSTYQALFVQHLTDTLHIKKKRLLYHNSSTKDYKKLSSFVSLFTALHKIYFKVIKSNQYQTIALLKF